mmetsp:Transcript_33659/g.106927  ORF Transcript_33659/g.106927 Transcript_33659/m.106927 type:complete len:722 (-) Transcript_33659:224-2389(-)
MNAQSFTPTSQWSNLLVADLDGALGDVDALESSNDEEEEDGALLQEALTGPPTDELAQRMVEHDAKLLRKIGRLRRRKQELKAMFAAYKQKEEEFVTQMDSHMDEVESTEHELSLKIETLTAENQQLRDFTDRRAQDNSECVEKLNETIKQCSESETRVQFLVDRIVALMSGGSADPAQTQAVVSMRQREQEMLRQLEETRQQFNEVRQQNGELTSRLTEELGLSRRLSDQLAEVEERFFRAQTEQPHAAEVPLPPRAGRLGPRPLGLRSDQTEAPDRLPLPELPPSISENEEPYAALPAAGEPQLEGGLLGGSGRRMPLGVVPETDVPPPLEAELEEGSEATAEFAEPSWLGTATSESNEADGNRRPASLGGDAGDWLAHRNPGGHDDLQLARASGSTQMLPAGTSSTSASTSARNTASGAAFMEQKLREALDEASFECAVVRVETGIYNFGPAVRAMVKLTPENDVVASRDDGHFQPIGEFIRNIAHEARGAPGTWAEPAGAYEGILGEPLPQPSRGAMGSSDAGSDGCMLEGFLAGHSADAACQDMGARAGGPVAAAPTPAPAAAVQGQWHAQAAGGPGVLGCGPKAQGLGAFGPPPLAAQCEVAGSRATQATQAGGGPVPPLQLHAASVPPLLGHRLSASTPERPRTRGAPSRPGTWSGQLISPRPTRPQKPGSGPPPPNPRMVLAPNAGPVRMGMAQSPGRQLCPPGAPSQLQFPN